MEAFLPSALGSSENIEVNHDNRNCGLLPAFTTTSSLRNEIPADLLQDDAFTLSPSENEQNALARQNSLQQSTHSYQEEPILQQDAVRQEQVTFPGHQRAQDGAEDVSEPATALFQEWNHAETGQDVRKAMPKPHSWKDKLGTFAIVGLIAGSVLLCAAIGTLAFMWFGRPAIPAWKEITARNWLSKAISICIGVIQQVMMLQLGIVAATLASLALESRAVVIGDVASVSTMRATATSTGAFVMAWQYLCGDSYRGARHSSNIFLIFSATLLWCLGQFLLLIILTDVSLRSTAGLVSPANLPYSLHYNRTPSDSITRFQEPSVGAWNRKISTYASFAEYSEPPYVADGVSDTGVTLRAFLPFGTAQDRENLESYKGNLTVLDARVTCQVPQIKNATVNSSGRVRGSLAPTRNTPRLANALLDKGSNANGPTGMGVHPDGSRDFECVMAKTFDESTVLQWGLSLCQLWKFEEAGRMKDFGGLYSEFQDPSLIGGADLQGSAYLALNNSLTIFDDIGENVIPLNITDVAEASQERGEWLDLFYSNGSVLFSASICYAAFDFADIEVSISSQSNRTESRLEPVFDQDTSAYTFQELRYAMGQNRSLGMDRRGILELAKGAWQVAPNEEYPDSQDFRDPQPDSVLKSYSLLALGYRMTADLAYTDTYLTRFKNASRTMATGILRQFNYCDSQNGACVVPEDMHILLVQEILKTNGSIAFALQTMITLLSGITYYDQMAQFDKWTQAEVAFFKTAQVPVGYVGFAVVAITVIAHCILVAYCVSLFLRKTTLSRLGASWSAVAQVATGDIMEYLGDATQASDNDFQARLKADGRKSLKACLEEVDGQVSVSIIGKDEEK